jgi:hypothetical protein
MSGSDRSTSSARPLTIDHRVLPGFTGEDGKIVRNTRITHFNEKMTSFIGSYRGFRYSFN